MPGLLSLPVELVLSIVELAAWSQVDSHRAWVASLCLVCRTFRAAASGPLYDLVVIVPENVERVLHTASLDNTPFTQTRAVMMSFFGTPFLESQSSDSILARAFGNAEYFAGSVRELLTLAKHEQYPALCPMVFVTMEVASDEDCTSLRPLLDVCTHLHVLVQLDQDAEQDAEALPDLRLLLGPRTRWLVVDAMASQPYPPERLMAVVEMLLPACERLLFRTLEICDDAPVDGFCALLRSIARDRKETRIWLDASPRHSDWSIFEHDFDDARRGRALWEEAGEQLYVP